MKLSYGLSNYIISVCYLVPLTFAASTVSQACQITIEGSLETSSDAIPVEIGMHNIHLLQCPAMCYVSMLWGQP